MHGDRQNQPQPPPPESPPATTTTTTMTMASRVADANRKLESTAQAAVSWGVQHECQIRDFEAELASALSNSRAVHQILLETLEGIEANRQRVNHALTHQIPHIHSSLHSSLSTLSLLQRRLPELQSHIHAIRTAYDSGRAKAQLLTADLEWKRLPAQDKMLRLVFSKAGSTPLGAARKREVWLARVILAVCAVLLVWQMAGALDGAVRAYKRRLVWGDKLIS